MEVKCLVAALLVAIVAAQDPVQPEEETLVRCKRPMCDIMCPLGNKLDSAGCPICLCLEDPCLEPTSPCPQGTMCQKQYECDGFPCEELPYTCEPVPCPQPMCAEYCEFGMEKNEYGCDTCQCRKDPCLDMECLADEECQVVDASDCQPGAYCNKVGKCVAKVPTHTEKPMLPECSLIECRMLCRFGFRKDERGCNMCECKDSPCEDVQCGRGEKCTHDKDKDCMHDICKGETQCSVKPLCEHRRDEFMDNMPMDRPMPGMGMMGPHGVGHRVARAAERIRRQLAHPLECNEEGKFQPRQCHHMTGDCWCVNDLGEEVEGTRRPANHPNGKPACPFNKTEAVKGHFQLKHNINEDLENHKDNLKVILTRHLGEWMMIKEEYIQQVLITPSGDAQIQTIKVDFVVKGDIEEDLDLASSVNHLRLVMESEETIIQYQSFTLKPVPHSCHAEHKFHAEDMVAEKPMDLGWGENYYRRACGFIRAHKTGFIAGAGGLLLLVLTLSVLACLVSKRRRVVRLNRADNYKQNLAFTNEVYGKLAFLDDMAKEKTPEVENNVTVA